MYQVPALGLGRSLKFLSAISSSTAIITGSFIAESFIKTLPWYIGLSWLSNIVLLSDYSYYNPLGEISKHLMDSLIIGTPLSWSPVLYTSVLFQLRGATQFGRLRLNPYGSPCPLVLVCVWRGDWPISPSKFHAYPSYRSVHCWLVGSRYWVLLSSMWCNVPWD